MPLVTYTDPYAAPEDPRQKNILPTRQRSTAGDRPEASADKAGNQPQMAGSIQDISNLTQTGAKISSRPGNSAGIPDAPSAVETANRIRTGIVQNASQAAMVHTFSSPQQVLAVLSAG